MWSTKNQKKGDRFIVTGVAYDQIVAGKNATNEVTTDHQNRESFYYDPAVKISEDELNQLDGVDGLPICVEHDRNDVVGRVHHSWMGDSSKKAMKIIAHIDQTTTRGKRMVADLRAGKYKGFSIGYETELITNGRTGKTFCDSKKIKEISLVAEPFFKDCHLSMGVEASGADFSKKLVSLAAGRNSTTNIQNYLSNTPNEILTSQIESGHFFVPLNMSDTSASAPTTTTTSNTSTPSNPSGGGGGGSTLPTNEAQRNAVSGEEMLRQADSLKTQVNEESRARQDLAKKLEQLEAENKKWRDEDQARIAAYAKNQEPILNQYVAELESIKASKLSEKALAAYKETFCNPVHKEAAEILLAEQRTIKELRASAKAAQDKLVTMEEDKKKLESAVTKTTAAINQSRAEFAKAVDGGQASQEDEQRRKLQEIAASGLGPNQILVPPPSISELPFLKAYGYTNEISVNASNNIYGTSERLFTKAVPVAAGHRMLKDEEGNLALPASARYHAPAFFSWMCDSQEMRSGDLSDVVNLVASKNTVIRKDVDTWEHQQRLPVPDGTKHQ